MSKFGKSSTGWLFLPSPLSSNPISHTLPLKLAILLPTFLRKRWQERTPRLTALSLLVSSPWHLHLGLCLPPIPTQVFQALPKVSSDFGTRFHHLLPAQEQRISTSSLALLHPPHCTFCLTILFLILKRKNFSQSHPLPLSVTTPLSLLSSVAKLPQRVVCIHFLQCLSSQTVPMETTHDSKWINLTVNSSYLTYHIYLVTLTSSRCFLHLASTSRHHSLDFCAQWWSLVPSLLC